MMGRNIIQNSKKGTPIIYKIALFLSLQSIDTSAFKKLKLKISYIYKLK